MFIPYHIDTPQGTLSLQRVNDTPEPLTRFDERGYFEESEIRSPADDVYTYYGRRQTSYKPGAGFDPRPRTQSPAFSKTFSYINTDADLTWDKDFEPNEAMETIRQTEWRDPVPEVAASLLSRLILRHPFPNANHRTSLSIVCLYLATVTDRAVEGSLHPETLSESELNAFISESTRTVTFNRNQGLFHALSEYGIDGVTRKGGLTLAFTDRMMNANLEKRHRQDCLGLITEWVDETGAGKTHDDGFRAFQDRVSVSEYNLRALAKAFAPLRD